ncbi:ferritin-like domain-containing protein [Acidiferrobacter sp. SPIII_3]|uniref:ferritin-like domain-containing protein n=1 Tax=Acidiferrobacter sp. SPIII_3 TaxID=1281578 RepID=UPI00197AB28C|nr:ferritin-like domain-containing protein [Acidiferrobacter sp. SPIII_3]
METHFKPFRRRWSPDDIPYDQVDRAMIADDRDWFYLLAASSFVEILSDLYARNLGDYYAGDDETCAWLAHKWGPEEVQHGEALKRYVLSVWPDFDWQRGFDGFRADYAPYCETARLGPTRTLEMAARCVVETGTSSFYGMLRHASPEPVLAALAGHIRDDEIGHYKGFYRIYRDYQGREPHSRWRVAREIWRRVAEIDSEDAYLAVKNVSLVCESRAAFTRDDFRAFRNRIRVWMRRHYPFQPAVKMLLTPLDLPASLQRFMVSFMAGGARLIV